MEFFEGFYDDDERDNPLVATKSHFYEEIKASNSRKHTTVEK